MLEREYFPIKMNPAEVFKTFLGFDISNFQIINAITLQCFAIKDLEAKLAIQKLLLKDAVKANPKAAKQILVSNKRKPLILSLHLEQDKTYPMWELRVYQERAKGIVLNKFSHVNSYSSFPFEISVILLMLTEKYLKERESAEIRKENQSLRLELKNFHHEQMLLDAKDLHIYLDRADLTSFEKKQVIYTKEYYTHIYDEHADRIDDGQTYNKVIKSNHIAEIILGLCEQCFEKFSAYIDIDIDVTVVFPENGGFYKNPPEKVGLFLSNKSVK